MTFATIAEENRVAVAIDVAIRRNPRLADLWDALKWRLSRDPESGLRLADDEPPFLYVARSRSYPGIPSIRVAYRFDPEKPIALTIVGVEVL